MVVWSAAASSVVHIRVDTPGTHTVSPASSAATVRSASALCTTIRGDSGHFRFRQLVQSQSEAIRAVAWQDSVHFYAA